MEWDWWAELGAGSRLAGRADALLFLPSPKILGNKPKKKKFTDIKKLYMNKKSLYCIFLQMDDISILAQEEKSKPCG